MPEMRYYIPTADPIFKYLMSNDIVRNGFLSAAIGEEILHSKITSLNLNPFPVYKELRSLINRKDIVEMMDEFEKIDPSSLNLKDLKKLPNKESIGLIRKAIRFIRELSPRYYELAYMLPKDSRDTELDVICETETGWVNIEMQVQPQNFWDLRILDHVCGLFHRQFTKGFKWSDVNEDNLDVDIRRAIGVSLFVTPPRHPESLQSLLPWYNSTPWKKDELRRTFKLMDENNNQIVRSGLEFYDFNLEAFFTLKNEHGFGDCPQELINWISFFASAQDKNAKDVKGANYSEAIKIAYELIKNPPKDIKEEYSEYVKRQENISFYVAAVKEEGEIAGIAKGKAEGEAIGIAKGKREVVLNLLAEGLEENFIAKITGLSIEEINQIKLKDTDYR